MLGDSFSAKGRVYKRKGDGWLVTLASANETVARVLPLNRDEQKDERTAVAKNGAC